MALFNKAKTLTAVALAATAFTALPATASANDYRCEKKNDEAQVIGGVIGAVLGGVVGSEVAARGNGNEGAFLGAALGAAAGAGLGDESVKCRRERDHNNYRTADYDYDSGYQPAVVNVGHRGRGHRNYRHYEHRNYRGYNDIDYQIRALRKERDELKYRNRYDSSRWIDRRLRRIGRELDRLKDIRRNRSYYGHRNNYRRNNYRRGHYHGRSRNLFYSDH